MDSRTHHVEAFTRRDVAGRERAVCGEWVVQRQIAPAETAPTCWGCAMWVDNLDVIYTDERRRERNIA